MFPTDPLSCPQLTARAWQGLQEASPTLCPQPSPAQCRAQGWECSPSPELWDTSPEPTSHTVRKGHKQAEEGSPHCRGAGQRWEPSPLPCLEARPGDKRVWSSLGPAVCSMTLLCHAGHPTSTPNQALMVSSGLQDRLCTNIMDSGPKEADVLSALPSGHRMDVSWS